MKDLKLSQLWIIGDLFFRRSREEPEALVRGQCPTCGHVTIRDSALYEALDRPVTPTEPGAPSEAKPDPDIAEEYDFSKGKRGVYYRRVSEGTQVHIVSDAEDRDRQNVSKRQPPSEAKAMRFFGWLKSRPSLEQVLKMQRGLIIEKTEADGGVPSWAISFDATEIVAQSPEEYMAREGRSIYQAKRVNLAVSEIGIATVSNESLTGDTL